MILPFEFAQRPINIGGQTEQWRIRKTGLTFRCFRNDQHYETGNAEHAVAFFCGGREDLEVVDAARVLVGTVDETLGNWPPPE